MKKLRPERIGAAQRVGALDVAIGARLRLFRNLKSLSQEQLSRQLGISFQQIQKYESGKNRIPVARLAVIADLLDVPLLRFVESNGEQNDHPASDPPGASGTLPDTALSSDTLTMLKLFNRLPNRDQKQLAIRLVRALLNDSGADRKRES